MCEIQQIGVKLPFLDYSMPWNRFLKLIFKMWSNGIEHDLAVTETYSSASMKVSGLIPDLHHKDHAHYLSSLF